MLYEENDETSVSQLSINVPAARSENVELMRYPRAGFVLVDLIFHYCLRLDLVSSCRWGQCKMDVKNVTNYYWRKNGH